MNPPEIEQLISEAVNNRPKVTNAPMNLYIYDKRLICGARIVMPSDAVFVAHLMPHQLDTGFSNKEWKLTIDKIENITATENIEIENNKTTLPHQDKNIFGHHAKAKPSKSIERRREDRLRHRSPVLFGDDFKQIFSQGRMLNISSGGLAFSYDSREKRIRPNQKIATRFDAPRFNPDNSFDIVSFDRRGHICRINKLNNLLSCIAVQFAKPLPFKPAEQKFKSDNPLSLEMIRG